MWRSFFLAIGAYCCLLGIEALAVEKAVVKVDPGAQQIATREIVPPDWAPWSLLGTGAVVVRIHLRCHNAWAAADCRRDNTRSAARFEPAHR
jgi:hypothetical protein